MIKKTLSILAAATLLASPVFAANYKAGVILVGPKAGASAEAVSKDLKANGAKFSKKLKGMNTLEVTVPKGKEKAIIQKLAKSKNFKFAELNYSMKPAYVANDTYFNNAWHIHKMNIDEAWDISEGAGITVAVADTGVLASHVDLSGKVLPGFNTYDNTTNTADDNGHGTAVAGTVGAHTNNGIGVSSVAGKVKILPIKINHNIDGYAYYSDMAEAVTYATNNGARVVNVSYGGGGNSSTIQSAASYMVSRGGVVVWAAGNDNTNPGYYDNPNIILVSATGTTDVRTSWSNFGAFVDVAAPGIGIYTTSRSGGYSTASGTSFSSPIVAGVVANMLSVNPNLTAPQVDAILKDTAVDLGTAGEDIYYGAGRVNAYAAVLAARNAPVLDTMNPTVSIVSPTVNSTVNGSVEVKVSASDNVGVAKVDLLVNSNTFATETASPYNFILDTTKYSNGYHTLGARATDTSGNVSTQEVRINVQNGDTIPPVVNIVSPSSGFVIGNKNQKIRLSSSDNSGSAVSMTLRINGSQVASYTGTSATYNWNTRKLAAGTYTITLEGRDPAGNTSSVSVTGTKR